MSKFASETEILVEDKMLPIVTDEFNESEVRDLSESEKPKSSKYTLKLSLNKCERDTDYDQLIERGNKIAPFTLYFYPYKHYMLCRIDFSMTSIADEKLLRSGFVAKEFVEIYGLIPFLASGYKGYAPNIAKKALLLHALILADPVKYATSEEQGKKVISPDPVP